MHGHSPYGQVHYYLGRYKNERFYPEMHGRMTWPGGTICAPETLLDEKGRRIFWGWIRESRPWTETGWASVASLPCILTLGKDGNLRMEPVPELESLRLNHRRRENISLDGDSEVELPEARGACLELAAEIEPLDAQSFGMKVRCSPDGSEQAVIICEPKTKTLKIEVKVSKSPTGSESDTQEQVAPFELEAGETLKLRVFLDRSVLEVFANGRQYVTQRIYPNRNDSLGVYLFARGGKVSVKYLDAWDMEPVNSW